MAAPLFIVAVLVLTYAPVVWLHYGFSDDYAMLDQARLGQFPWIHIAYGRPLTAWLSWVLFKGAWWIENLGAIRALSIFTLALAALCLYRAFRMTGRSRMLAATASAIVFLMPPYQMYASWAQEFFAGPAIVLAFLAFVCVWYATTPAARGAALFTFPCLAIAAVTAACALYQPLAMCYWAFFAIFASTRLCNLKLTALFVSVGLLGMLGGVEMLKICQYFVPVNGARSKFVADYGAKAAWFFYDVLRRSAGLNAIDSTLAVSAILLALILAGLATYCWTIGRGRFAQFATLVLLIPLASAPSLATSENWASCRSMGALTMLLTIFAVLAIHGAAQVVTGGRDAPRILYPALLGWAASSALLASRDVVSLVAVPQIRELDFISTQLGLATYTERTRVVMIQGSVDDHLSENVYFDEFGMPSASTDYGASAMLDLLAPPSTAGRRRVVGPNESFTPGPDDVVVDMTKLGVLR